MKQTKAILVVSFGTSYADTRKKTIEAIEQELAESFPDYRIYRAWTSKMIIKKLKTRDQVSIDTVSEAMMRMKQDGITDVIIQPTHVINGTENDLMKADATAYASDFSTLRFGTPLLTDTADFQTVVKILGEHFPADDPPSAVVFMGHGTEHHVNASYAALDYHFKEAGYEHIFIGTVEAYPDIDTILEQIKPLGYQKILLVPFMIVAGDHARNDMIGDSEDSWKTKFEKEGFEVRYLLKGLGEYEEIRNLFKQHVKQII